MRTGPISETILNLLQAVRLPKCKVKEGRVGEVEMKCRRGK